MAFTFPTSANQLQAFAGALYGVQIGSATMAQVTSDIAAVGGLNNALNNYYAASFSGVPTATVAASVATNLGLTGDLLTAGTTYVAAQLNAAAPSARGVVIKEILNLFSNLAADATFGAAATAWNNKVAAAASYSGATDVTMGSTASEGKAFTLSNNADSGKAFAGGSGDDTYNGVVGKTLASADGTTFNPGDNLDGGQGKDTLNVSIAGNVATEGDADISAITLNNIEVLSVSNYETTTKNNTINLSSATGLTTVALAGSSATGDTLLTNVKNIVAAEMANGSGDLSLTYADAAVTGTADVQTLSVSGVTGGTFTVAATTPATGGVETLAITSSGSTKNVLTAVANDAALKTITVAGDQSLTLGNLGAAVTKLDASASKGGITATLSATTTTAVTGSAGNDSITTAAALTTGSVNAGDGTDTLVLAADAHVNSTTLGAKYTNFETLNISQTQTITTDADWTDRAQDVSLVAGVTKVGLSTLALTSTFNSDNAANTTVTVGYTNLPAAVTDLTISGLSYTDTDTDATDDDVALTVTAGRKVDTAADALTVTLGTATAAAGNAADATDALTLNVTLAGEETISLVSQGAANTITTLSATALKTLNASGAKALTLTAVTNNTATSVINASGMTADFSIAANASTTASTITGGTGNDNLVGGTKADSIDGGAGNDNITGAAGADKLFGGEGNDTFTVGTAADFQGMATAETVDGGAGNDTLKFTADMTLVASDIAAVKDVETFEFSSVGANSITLSDAYFTNAGVTNIAIKDTDATAALTVAASAVTSANSVTVTANSANTINDGLTGGAGNDTFNFTTKGHAAALDGSDTVNGGKGSDTLAIALDTNDLTATTLTAVSNIEKITVSGSGALKAGLTLANGNFVTETVNGVTTTVVGVIDASGMTGNGALTLDGAAETDSALSITGGNGNDSLTGGSKADTIVAAAGDDTLVGGAGIDSLDGGSGNDTFTVATLAHFVGLANAEVVIGGAGNDTLKFSDNAATAVNSTDLGAISGIETIEFSGTGTSSITLTDSVFTANGATSLKITDTESTAALTVNAAGLSAANSVAVTASLGATINDSLAGGSGNDTFTFTTNDAATALTSTDSVNGAGGTDTLAITLANSKNLAAVTLTAVSNIEKITVTGATTLTAGLTLVDGNFVSVTGAVVDASAMTGTGALTFSAAAEAESTLVITGGAGADAITGGQKADTINGGSGADTITGGAGADSLTGGNGADTFVYTSASVAHSSGTTIDTIADFATTTDKIQITLDYSAQSAMVDVNANFVASVNDLSAKRGEVVYDSTAGQLNINVNNDNLITTQDFKIGVGTVAAGDINFVITGTAQGDSIVGGAGADTISGGGGADSLTGGAGADSITGGGAVDKFYWTATTASALATEAGTTVGGSADFAAGTVGDTVLSFTSGTDKLNFKDGLFTGSTTNTLKVIQKTGIVADADRFVFIDNAASGDNVHTIAGAVTILNALTTSSVAIGDSFIAIMENDTDSFMYLVKQVSAADTIAAQDVTLIGRVNGVTIATGDFVSAA